MNRDQRRPDAPIGQPPEGDFFAEKLASSHQRHAMVLQELATCFLALSKGDYALSEGDQYALEDDMRYLERSLPRHYADEEESFFPRVARVIPAAYQTIAQLTREHAEHLAEHQLVVQAIRALLLGDEESTASHAATAQRLAALQAAAAAHIRLEDECFPAWNQALGDADRAAMDDEFGTRRGRGGGGNGGGSRGNDRNRG